MSTGASFDGGARNASQFWALDQNGLHPPTTPQSLTGCTQLDGRHSWAAALGFRTGPTRWLVWKLSSYITKTAQRKCVSKDIAGKK